jgi:hypothetical protein
VAGWSDLKSRQDPEKKPCTAEATGAFFLARRPTSSGLCGSFEPGAMKRMLGDFAQYVLTRLLHIKAARMKGPKNGKRRIYDG